MTSQNRDPRVKPEDDIVRNSRIPSANLEFPKHNFLGILEFLRQNLEFLRINLEFLKDCFASPAMTQGILEFLTYFKLKFSLNVTFRYTGK